MTPQALIDAMDGIALLLDREFRIVAAGWPNWNSFLRENDGPDYSRDQVVGRRIHDFFTAGEVRETYRQAFERVLVSEWGELRVTYRCDAPHVQRLMRLSVTRVDGGANLGLLYQSVLLHATERPQIGFYGVPVRPLDREDLLTICSLCARVAWPKGASADERAWIEANEYYRRGGEDVTELSHGFCRECFDRLMAEMD